MEGSCRRLSKTMLRLTSICSEFGARIIGNMLILRAPPLFDNLSAITRYWCWTAAWGEPPKRAMEGTFAANFSNEN